jgi:hypothetical protein
MLTASAFASIAFAAPSGSAQSSTFVLSGEILVYAPSESGLPLSTLVAPRGARVDRALLMNVDGISSADADGSNLESSPLIHGRSPLVMGEQSPNPLQVGDLTLRHDADGWTLFASGDEIKGRPVFRLVGGESGMHATRDGGFTLTGELLLHEVMADELGLRGSAQPPSFLAGSFTLVASPAQGGLGATLSTQASAPSSAATLPPPPVAGPDVIVSTIGSSLTKNATVGTITAYSVTTVSCNIGTTDAEWFANTAHHPVIGTQFYRFKTVSGASRFEEIGISWLKHGFCAADAPSCGSPYVQNGSCDWLGEFATDTYGSGLNGQQSNLGPRSEVNAFTGSYPYPYVLGAGTGDPGGIYKRCQVENADMDPAQNTGASYFGEVVYITTDEPSANRYNNYSNRPFTVGAISGGGYPATFSGSTNTQQAAIQRWPLLDAGVTLVTVDVPGDGRFYVGGKATSLGGGNYHYEYAVFNMNSHQSARLVSVPADNTVTVSNVGFHDVPYHSGEPYDGTDWGGSKTATAVEWSTSTFATNPNANALRWSTLYNFRFDANAPPITGDVTLGLFRLGGSATAVGLPVPGSGLPQNLSYCFGDGSGTTCPCGNNSSPVGVSGCVNSILLSGILGVSGTPSVSADTLALVASGMPNGPAMFFQGTAQNGGGVGFGDGLLCVGGSITRLGIEFNVAGASQYPSGVDPAVSVQGVVGAPGVRTYQVWYRDADPTFCGSSTFNLSNGRQVVWIP